MEFYEDEDIVDNYVKYKISEIKSLSEKLKNSNDDHKMRDLQLWFDYPNEALELLDKFGYKEHEYEFIKKLQELELTHGTFYLYLADYNVQQSNVDAALDNLKNLSQNLPQVSSTGSPGVKYFLGSKYTILENVLRNIIDIDKDKLFDYINNDEDFRIFIFDIAKDIFLSYKINYVQEKLDFFNDLLEHYSPMKVLMAELYDDHLLDIYKAESYLLGAIECDQANIDAIEKLSYLYYKTHNYSKLDSLYDSICSSENLESYLSTSVIARMIRYFLYSEDEQNLIKIKKICDTSDNLLQTYEYITKNETTTRKFFKYIQSEENDNYLKKLDASSNTLIQVVFANQIMKNPKKIKPVSSFYEEFDLDRALDVIYILEEFDMPNTLNQVKAMISNNEFNSAFSIANENNVDVSENYINNECYTLSAYYLAEDDLQRSEFYLKLLKKKHDSQVRKDEEYYRYLYQTAKVLIKKNKTNEALKIMKSIENDTRYLEQRTFSCLGSYIIFPERKSMFFEMAKIELLKKNIEQAEFYLEKSIMYTDYANNIIYNYPSFYVELGKLDRAEKMYEIKLNEIFSEAFDIDYNYVMINGIYTNLPTVRQFFLSYADFKIKFRNDKKEALEILNIYRTLISSNSPEINRLYNELL